MSKSVLHYVKRIIWERVSLLSSEKRERLIWFNTPPEEKWYSFDRTPWRHPWLNEENIRRFRQFNSQWLDAAVQRNRYADEKGGMNFAFVGNMANNMFSRARVLRKSGMDVDVFIHPHDRSLMGQPGWEDFDGTVPDGVTTLEQLQKVGMQLPVIDGVYTPEISPLLPGCSSVILENYRLIDYLRYEEWFPFLPMLQALNKYKALLAAQSPFLAYLSRTPYAVTQMGGDIWYECSRDDKLGRIQRRAYQNASAYIFSNPWGLAFARRYGLRNLVYMPYLIDEDHYSPGPASLRNEWKIRSGGEFFVMISARLDYYFKGSDVALRAFALFSATAPDARLVITGWGSNKNQAEALLTELGILGKVLVVPVAGKRRLVEYLRSADCVLDQFSMGYFGATGLEAFACGVPVVMKLAREQYDALIFEGAPPVCHADDVDSAAKHLTELRANMVYRMEVGSSLRQWFLSTHGRNRWSSHYKNLMYLTAHKITPGFGKSPLQEKLSMAEQDYHQNELAAAPKFPIYF